MATREPVAVLHVAAVEFTCPHCGEHVSNPNGGSHLFPVAEGLPAKIACDFCDVWLSLPAKARALTKPDPKGG